MGACEGCRQQERGYLVDVIVATRQEIMDKQERLKALLAEALPYVIGKGGYMNHRNDIVERIRQELKP